MNLSWNIWAGSNGIKNTHNEMEDLAISAFSFLLQMHFQTKSLQMCEFNFLWTINVVAYSEVSDKLCI